jgi:hypothetical protein
MERRKFLKSVSAFAITCPFVSQVSGNHFNNSQFDQYGGWDQRKFKATGFFRVEKDERWWFVTPEGNAFLSFGINHIHPDWWNQPYNRAAWKEILGVSELRGPEFNQALRNWFMEYRHHFGINTIGVHNDLNVLNQPSFMPYLLPIRFVDIAHWRTDVPDENFIDVFSDRFRIHCEALAKEIAAPVAEDPFLIGYAMTDCPLLTEEDCRTRTDVIGGRRRGNRVGWPRRLRNLGPDAPGKRRYVELMKALYRNNIDDFNDVYDTGFGSFEEITQTINWRPDTDLSNGFETRDNIEFLKLVVKKYYQTTHDAIHSVDPNHLFFGDKLNGNTDTLDTVLPVTSEFVDVNFYQMYAKYGVQEIVLDRWSKMTDKPFVNGDSAFSTQTEMTPRPFGAVAASQNQKAEWTAEFFRKAFSRTDFIGWHYCGLIDTWVEGGIGNYFTKTDEFGSTAGRQHTGLSMMDGTPYQPIQKILKECTDNLYQIAVGDYAGSP